MKFGPAIGAAAALSIFFTAAACGFFNAAPMACIEAAEDAGLPDRAIDQLRKPGDLNPAQRAGLQQALKRAGIEDACSAAIENVDASDDYEPTFPTLGPLASIWNRDQEGMKPRSEQTREAQQTLVELIKADEQETRAGARIPDDENRRRCMFWALNNLKPLVYDEFSKLDPDDMDDLERILWREQLHTSSRLGYYEPPQGQVSVSLLQPRDPGVLCRDFWAEALNQDNADLRNHGFEIQCRDDLQQRMREQYRNMASYANDAGEDAGDLPFQYPNQYARILKWLDLSGGDLLNAGNPPYRLFREQSRHAYAHLNNWRPTEANLSRYREEYDVSVRLEHLGILHAAGLSSVSKSNLPNCQRYYPQLFYGYWIPFHPDDPSNVPANNDVDSPRYSEEDTPIYLPRHVSAERIPHGYPLGEHDGHYRLCDQSDQNSAEFYYVNHPAGNYCERKR